MILRSIVGDDSVTLGAVLEASWDPAARGLDRYEANGEDNAKLMPSRGPAPSLASRLGQDVGWLREAVPERLPESARAYRRGAYSGRADRERILARVDRARARHGLHGPHALDGWAAGASAVQLRLWV
jgi:hypothetical protein